VCFALGSVTLGSWALGSPPPAGGAGGGTARAAAGLQRASGCLADGSGYFRARIRGAMNLDLDWRNSELECEGGARLRGGMRLSFAGPIAKSGGRLRIVLGVSELGKTVGDGAGVATGHDLPTNLTVIVEGGQRLFATRGDDKCTMDSLRLEPLSGEASAVRTYRAVARGFCTAPASGITRNERIVVTQFDFAGRIGIDRDALSSPPR
jgi:hypothetical protein